MEFRPDHIFSAVLGSKLLLVAGHWHDFLSYPLADAQRYSSADRQFRTDGARPGHLRRSALHDVEADALAGHSGCGGARMGFGSGNSDVGLFFRWLRLTGVPPPVPWGVVFHSRWAALWNGTPLGVKLQPVQLYLFAVQLAFVPVAALVAASAVASQEKSLGGMAAYFPAWRNSSSTSIAAANRLLVLGGALSLTQAIDFCMVVLGALLLLEKRPVRLRT